MWNTRGILLTVFVLISVETYAELDSARLTAELRKGDLTLGEVYKKYIDQGNSVVDVLVQALAVETDRVYALSEAALVSSPRDAASILMVARGAGLDGQELARLISSLPENKRRIVDAAINTLPSPESTVSP